MLKNKPSNNHKRNLWSLVAGMLITACLSHHIFSIWDRKAIWTLLVFIFFSPPIAWVLSKVFPQIEYAFRQIKNKQVLYILSAIILGTLATLKLYEAPVSYQTIFITPQVSQNQEVELLEIKVGGDILPIKTKAVENGWSYFNGVLTAKQNSQPLQFIFPVEVNSKISVLLNSSPQSGNILVSLGGSKREVDLSTPSQQQKLITFRSNYRIIPRWLFIPFLVISDLFTFSLLFFVILVLQEKGQEYFVEDSSEKFFSKRVSLIILIILSSLLHLFNALAVPLIVSSDSPHYLQGAVHWLEYGNLDGVSPFCGPGSTFLFAPVLLLFGRNPWGMKVFLHLIAIACVLVGYRLGWQLSKKRWIAFSVGFITMLLPDLYYYSNFIMSDLINLFLVVLFASLLLDALENNSFFRILLPLVVASFATLLRSENLLLLVIGIFCLGIQPAWDWLKGISHKKDVPSQRHNLKSLGILFLAVLIALVPLCLWSFKNLQLNGRFSLRNSPGTVLYDGWIYYTEASGIEIRDEDSSAVQEIEYWITVYPIEITDSSGIATGGEIYPSLIKAGYSSQEAFQLLEQATLNSLKSNLALIPKILKLKVKDAFKPIIYHTVTFPLPGESLQISDIYTEYFSPSIISIPQIINLQRAFYEFFHNHLTGIYRFITLLSLAAAFFSLYRSPFLKWFTLLIIMLTRIFITNLISIAMWRYTIAGIGLLVVFGVMGIAVLIYGFKDIFIQSKE